MLQHMSYPPFLYTCQLVLYASLTLVSSDHQIGMSSHSTDLGLC